METSSNIWKMQKILKLIIFFLNWANPGLFFVYFRSFQTNNTILQQINVKKCHVHPVSGAGIRTHDLFEANYWTKRSTMNEFRVLWPI